ncbi:protein of unknown function [Nitrospira japonica]|uniref:PilZ domain-containing protein n=1 Tax=Nitrospira japonica TaxID=1325564 RepID=A0A1W1I877_9BACT|nr:PilZ domain-containing protein [Nitrospira japonica]SLM49217.1 protein of unknown function [Nitrospira japonica]
MPDPRSHTRIPVRVSGCFAYGSGGWIDGIVVDLSAAGCCLETRTRIQPPSFLQLILTASAEDLPISIDLAVVRWVKEGKIGVRFLSLQAEQHKRLHCLLVGDRHTHDIPCLSRMPETARLSAENV